VDHGPKPENEQSTPDSGLIRHMQYENRFDDIGKWVHISAGDVHPGCNSSYLRTRISAGAMGPGGLGYAKGDDVNDCFLREQSDKNGHKACLTVITAKLGYFFICRIQ